eukprot:CAMPEP_0117424184 /NCGR_PEP_ID=MMETSP0758-20121206/4654_1 /TAXON_ID=63605 /ORGANISM="Percolomonas cosmopolitus, Strain AE-1 (ATCC 50343)" /LENGTH=79 /DNA_ID=CAMNT_0005207811 /DNA_START=48 /DNA_END=287 /DNA_ORIENTATION=+
MNLTPEQIEDLKKGFAEVDEDGNGTIDKKELATLFQKMFGDDDDIDIEASVEAAFEGCDVDNDGTISFEEYVKLATSDN